MPGLCCEEQAVGVGGGLPVFEGDLFDLCIMELGEVVPGDGSHGGAGFDARQGDPTCGKRDARLAGASTDFSDRCGRVLLETCEGQNGVDEVRRVRRAPQVIGLRDLAEHEPLLV